MFKKILSIVLAFVMIASLGIAFASCSPADNSGEAKLDPVPKEEFKLGVILLHDEFSTYDLNFMNGIEEARVALGLREDQVIIKKNIDEFFNEQYSVYGYCQKSQPYNPFGIGRMLPMLCWMNVPMLQREGAKYFDPERTYGLLPGGKQNRNNWYDTGAPLLEDILSKRPRLKGYHRDIREFVEHFGSGSWQNNSLDAHKAWLEQHKDLWL